MISENLWYAYTQVRFEFEQSVIKGDFCIITAWNPRSIRLSKEQNQERNHQLQQWLTDYDWMYVTVVSHDGHWYEESFAVNISFNDALLLANRLSQNAIYQIKDGLVILRSSLDQQRLNLGPLVDFID